jgi:hypothetical protein
MKRDILEKPFDPARIKQRVGTYALPLIRTGADGERKFKEAFSASK